jgi:thiol-disulfide isomerase/thioredoxin
MRSRLRLLLLLAVCVVAGILTGRALWQSAPAPPAVTGATTVPAFELQDLASGARRSIRDWSADALIINFWATWCAPCRKEMPLLEQVHQQRHGSGLAVVGIAIDRLEPVRTFIGETGISYPILVGEQDAMAAAEAFGPAFVGLPLTVVAAPGGEILKLHVGELHASDLDLMVDVLDQLIAGRMTIAEARKRLAGA